MMFHVKDAMTTDVVTVSPETSVDDACSLLVIRNISGLPVVDSDAYLVGIVSELDFLSLLTSSNDRPQSVADFMRREVVSVNEHDYLTDVAELFQRHEIRRLPVVRGRRLVGIICRRDIIQFIRKLRARLGGQSSGRTLEFRTQKEIADFCRVSAAFIQRQIRSGRLDVRKADGEYKIDELNLTQLVADQN